MKIWSRVGSRILRVFISPNAGVPKLCAAAPWGAVESNQGRREALLFSLLRKLNLLVSAINNSNHETSRYFAEADFLLKLAICAIYLTD
jgi:hypothetical protein